MENYFTEGAVFICTEEEWYNAFGDRCEALNRGMRVTLRGTHRVGGALFLRFKETPEGNSYMSTGFKPLRSLN